MLNCDVRKYDDDLSNTFDNNQNFILFERSPKTEKAVQPKLGEQETIEELEELLITSPRDRKQIITTLKYSGTLEDVIKSICEEDDVE